MSKYTTKEAILADKEGAISEKMEVVKFSDPIFNKPFQLITTLKTTKTEEGALKTESENQEGIINVKVVANSTNVLDSHMDVHVKGNYDEAIQNKEGYLHIDSHERKTSARIGIVKNVTTEEIKFRELGIDKEGTTECLVYESEVMKDLNPNIYFQYKSGFITEHSIGMLYKELLLATNEQGSEEYKVWKQYIDQIANPEKALEKGFFWVVKNIELIECSAVLKGSNHATPTLHVSSKEEKQKEIQNGLQDTEAQLLEQAKNLINQKLKIIGNGHS